MNTLKRCKDEIYKAFYLININYLTSVLCISFVVTTQGVIKYINF